MPLAAALLFSAAQAVPPPESVWETLQQAPVRVECTTWQEAPWCRATGVFGAAPATVASTLEAMDRHTEVFHALVQIEQLAPGLVHAVLDYPSPLADREYVARYESRTDGQTQIYAWAPATHAGASLDPDRVLLSEMAGEWQLTPEGPGTQVIYLWQADIGGSPPAWALPRARKLTGTSVLQDLAKATGGELSAP